MAKKETTTKVKKATKADKSNKTVAELRADLLTARKSLYDGTLQNPHAVKAARKEVARALTRERAAEIATAKEAKKGEK